MRRPTAIDLFCGAGGLTIGLKQAGFDVIAALDADKTAVETYRMNHGSSSEEEDGVQVWHDLIQREGLALEIMSTVDLTPGELDLLAGCPPCEGFSDLRTLNGKYSYEEDEKKNDLVYEYLRLVKEFEPKSIMMENVPGLARDDRMDKVLCELFSLGYGTELTSRDDVLRILDASDYAVPQRRKRMVLIAGKGFGINFAEKAEYSRTVEDAIGHLPNPETGTEKDREEDPLHYHGEQRTEEILNIMSRIEPGQSRRDLPREDWLECQKNTDGFKDVYGRMERGDVAPTITSGCTNPSKGRFIHPDMDQNRAITLREAALLQTFPEDYEISMTRGKNKAAELIGDALPPEFVRRHANQIRASLLKNVR
jgi:DNA (cytosine-5)-methyltransferase 1